jgi:imidazolonepropionase-like amidohydrolase
MVATSRALAIEHVTLIDGRGGPPLADATVVFRDGRVQHAGAAARLPIPQDSERLDGRGRWLIPGLVDLHVHVTNCGAESLSLWLANGITTVRDIGGNAEWLVQLRGELASGERTGPRLFTHGPMIDGAPSGFRQAAQMGGAPTFERMWAEVDGPDAAVAEVDRLLAAGVDGLKLYQLLPLEPLQAILRHVDGRIPVTGHLTRTRASDAIAAGINCLEHNFVTPYNDVCRPEDRTPDGSGWQVPGFILRVHEGWARADLDAPYVQAFIEQVVVSGVYYDPTMMWGTNALALEETEEQGERYLSPTMRRRREMQAEAARRAGRPPGPVQVGDDALLRASAERQTEFVSRLIAAGAAVMAGTDVGALPGIAGYSLHRELRWLVRLGMTPKQATETATRRAAEALRRADDQGTLAPGQRADAVLLDADPLADIRNTRRIHRVFKDGTAYDPAALLAEYERETAAATS